MNHNTRTHTHSLTHVLTHAHSHTNTHRKFDCAHFTSDTVIFNASQVKMPKFFYRDEHYLFPYVCLILNASPNKNDLAVYCINKKLFVLLFPLTYSRTGSYSWPNVRICAFLMVKFKSKFSLFQKATFLWRMSLYSSQFFFSGLAISERFGYDKSMLVINYATCVSNIPQDNEQ